MRIDTRTNKHPQVGQTRKQSGWVWWSKLKGIRMIMCRCSWVEVYRQVEVLSLDRNEPTYFEWVALEWAED